MYRRAKKKKKAKIKATTTDETLSKYEIDAEKILRLKVTVRKGARIESVPLKKLEKLSTQPKRFWKLKDEWLILYGL